MPTPQSLLKEGKRRTIAYLKTDRVDLILMLSALFLWILALGIPAWRLLPNINSEQIPLHYNVYLGIDRFGPWYYVFLPGLIGSVGWLINLCLEISFIHKDRLLVRLLSVVTLIFEFVLVVAVFFSTLLNI